MDRFKELATFANVARMGSLSAAARGEGLTPAMIGRRIDQLEGRLGVKLFTRSTRRVTMTSEGERFLEEVERIILDLDTAEASLAEETKSAKGRLIVSVPTAFGRKHIAPHMPKFAKLHPELEITLHMSERIVDLKNERYDLAIRIADMRNADLIAVKLASNQRLLCASPQYVKEFGRPKTLADLVNHRCLLTAMPEGLGDQWYFQQDGKPVAIRVRGYMHCNDGEVLTQWALAGQGIAWRSEWEVNDEIRRGRLVNLLPEHAAQGNHIYAVYPDRKHLAAKVRVFIEFLKGEFGDRPYWEQAQHAEQSDERQVASVKVRKLAEAALTR
jgi:DNA-binding transcriptional LysR family regulator